MGVAGAPATTSEGGETRLGRARHAVSCFGLEGRPRFAGWASGGFLCWHSSMMTPVLKTKAILDPGLPPQPMVYTRTLSVFSGSARVNKARRASRRSQTNRGPDFLASRLFYQAPMCRHGYSTRSSGRGDAQRSGARAFNLSDPGIRGVETPRSSAVIHTLSRIVRPKRGDRRGLGANRQAGHGAK